MIGQRGEGKLFPNRTVLKELCFDNEDNFKQIFLFFALKQFQKLLNSAELLY